jgi:hypothetical protein
MSRKVIIFRIKAVIQPKIYLIVLILILKIWNNHKIGLILNSNNKIIDEKIFNQ